MQHCRCGCGAETNVGKSFVTGHNATTHGMSNSRTYRSWQSMKQRVLNPKTKEFPRYGGRGIRICSRWKRFRNFLSDMGFRPKGTSLDRIDNDGHYKPSNCRWATRSEQANNTPLNHLIHWNGKILTITEVAREIKVNPNTFLYRLRRGWSLTEATSRSRRKA